MLTVRVTDRRAQGARLISPVDPSFDAMARPLIGERVADLVLELKPMLVIVSNESERTIASFSVVWTTRYQDGRTDTMWTHASFPSAISGLDPVNPDERGMAPGTRRIEANGIVVHGYGLHDPYFDQFIEQFDPRQRGGLDGAGEILIDLNAVIFADGTLVGPDERGQLQDLFSRYVTAQQMWLRGVRQALDMGQTPDTAFAAVERFQSGLRESRGRVRSHWEDPDHIWQVQTSADVIRWRQRHGDAAIPALIDKLNLEPLVIRAA